MLEPVATLYCQGILQQTRAIYNTHFFIHSEIIAFPLQTYGAGMLSTSQRAVVFTMFPQLQTSEAPAALYSALAHPRHHHQSVTWPLVTLPGPFSVPAGAAHLL